MKACWLIIIASSCFSCATYYQINSEFNQNFESGNIESAQKVLSSNSKAIRKKTKFLYYANRGVLFSMTGDYENSNKWLERAYLFGEDYQKNYANQVASFLVNPNTIVYQGEDHEHLLLLYYKSLNYLKLKDYESALIECRRLNNRLNELSDKYKSDKKYKRDAFIHNLMGVIYEASGDINNAFVAYRNALNIYNDDYNRLFGVEAPRQLKVDVLRMAYENGYDSDLDFYQKEFGMQYQPSSKEELVFFWHNGLGPVKSEWSVNFTTIPGGDGMMTFANEDLGLNFAFPVNDADQKGQLTDLRFFRVAFPKYEERKPYYSRGVLEANGQRNQLELAEDINAIAFKTLEERMLQEMGKGLLRAALKKSLEVSIRGDNDGDDSKKSDDQLRQEAIREGLSMVVGLLNAVTERADTRNWQTIPHSIYYTRMPMQQGANNVTLKTINTAGHTVSQTFEFQVGKGETVFHSYQSLEYTH
ncbi:MAG: hypothetical protein JXR10_01530 [Cyclobacteriaceae bacterium]